MKTFCHMERAENDVFEETGVTCKKVYGDSFGLPECHNFTFYLTDNITKYTTLFRELNFTRVIEKDIEPFSILALATSDNDHFYFHHTMIHIAHGICLNKTGTGCIYFQTVDQIKDAYEGVHEKPLQLVKLIRQNGSKSPQGDNNSVPI